MSSISAGPGAILVGVMLAVFLSGIAAALGLVYFRTFPGDRLIFRALACAMLSLTYALTSINTYYAWEVCITHFGEAEYLLVGNWALVCSFPVVAVSCAALQFFLIYRAWILSGRTNKAWNTVLVMILVVSLSASGLAFWFTSWFARQTTVASLLRETTPLYCWYALQTTGEALITSSLIYWVIINPQHQTSTLTPIGVAQRFALRAVETNLISVIAQLVIIVLIVNSTKVGMWYAALAFSMPSLYTISLMLALLSRASEEATFRFEAENGPIVTRSRAFNPDPVVSKVDVRIHDRFEFDSPTADTVRWNDKASARPPIIQFSSADGPEELSKAEEHELHAI